MKQINFDILEFIEIKKLSDDALWEQAKSTARGERELSLQLIELVREVISRHLHLKYGYESVFTYLVKELGFSQGSASRRLHALKVFQSTPAQQDEVREGKVTLSQVALFNQIEGGLPETKIEQFRQKTTEETKKILVEEFNVSPGAFSKKERITPRADETSTLTFTVDSSFLSDLKKLQELASHALHGSKELKTTFQYALTRTLQELRRRNGVHTNREPNRELSRGSSDVFSHSIRRKKISRGTMSPGRKPLSASQRSSQNTRQRSESTPRVHIPFPIQREKRKSAENQCEYRDPVTKKRCTSRHFL